MLSREVSGHNTSGIDRYLISVFRLAPKFRCQVQAKV